MQPRELASSGGLPRFLAAAAIFISLLTAIQVPARTFIVDRQTDTLDQRSLRGAVIGAQLGGRNVIVLTRSYYRLTIRGASEYASRTGDLDCMVGNLTIVGLGTNVTIDAGLLGDRAFRVARGAQLNLINVSIVGGGEEPAPNRLAGGAIYNEGILNADGCRFVGNGTGGEYSEGGDGGAIWNSGRLVLERCLMSNNFCYGWQFGGGACNGGALWNSGIALVNQCEFHNNVCGYDVDGGCGGAIYNRGTLKLYNSVLDGNFTTDAFYNYHGDSSPGGGIFNLGTAILDSCTITHNGTGIRAEADEFSMQAGNVGVGGGLCNIGSMAVNRCIISENTTGAVSPDYFLGFGGAGGDGAGLYNSGTLWLSNSTVSGNISANGGDSVVGIDAGTGGRGAGICNLGNATIVSSTISGNRAGSGGGIQDYPNGGNGATGASGGGIYNADSLALTSCTIVLNSAGNGGRGGDADDQRVGGNGGDGGGGGGVFCETNGSVTVANTLVALNRPGLGGGGGTGDLYIPDGDGYYVEVTNGVAGMDGPGNDVAGQIVTRGFNFVGQGEGSEGLANGLNQDMIGSASTPLDPQIGVLGNYGGKTPTHPLLSSSPLIDKGNSFGIGSDQRGAKRVIDNAAVANASGGDGSDIGAFELGTE